MKLNTELRSGSRSAKQDLAGVREDDFNSIESQEIDLKRILVPVDFSESARKAMHYAVSFARQFKAEVILLHVVEAVPPPTPSMMTFDPGTLNINLHEQAARQLSEWRQDLGPQISATAILRDGASSSREIVSAAAEKNVDLIILGTQGRTGLAHLVLGSTAEKVVRHAPCPVMVVREREHDFVKLEDNQTVAAKI